VTKRAVIVTWHDAHSDRVGQSWIQRDDMDDDPYVVTSAGFLLDPPKTGHVSVVQSVGDDGCMDHILHIPNGMIIAVRTLE
jgi:hypothetical protein